VESLQWSHWLLLVLGAAGIGVAKSGLAGVSLLHVLAFAYVFGAKDSTGVVLPLLVVGDLCASWLFGQAANWSHVRKLLPPAVIGIVLGWWLMDRLDEDLFRGLLSGIILSLTCIQLLRLWRPALMEHIPHSRWFAWSLGCLAGLSTMLANAAGPVVALYLLAVALPKMNLIGTSAWLFLILNVFKLPLSYSLGLISLSSLSINALLIPAIPVGMLAGRMVVKRLSQRLFDSLLLAFTAVVATLMWLR
jgi:uncharacterized membrane protein YfcA